MEHLEILNSTATSDEKTQEENNSNFTSPSKDILVRSISHRRVLQNFRLVWLDNSIDQTKNEDSINTIEKLRRVVNHVTKFFDIDVCAEFITNIKKEKIFLICSEEFGRTIVPIIHENVLVFAIYILSEDQTQHKNWVKPWPKIKGIYTNYNSICRALNNAAQVCDHNLVSISFVKKTDDEIKPDLDTLDPSFMYTQIMKEILLTIQFDQTHIEEFLTYCREQFTDNNIELQNLDKIEQEYFDHQPIWWYSYSCFFYPMLNRALRLMEVDSIIKLGFFLKDLHNNIATLYAAQFTEHHHLKSFVVYRGQGLSQPDFDELQQTQGGLLSFNSFLSTSSDRAVSFAFAESIQSSSSDMIGILFEMTIDPSISSSPFANIKNISYFHEEEEILLSMHSVFRIGQVKQIEGNNRLWQGDLTLTADTDSQLLALTDRIREETEGSTGWFRLGRLMITVAEYNKAEDLYKMLLPITTDEKEQDHIYYHLALIMYYRGEYMNAIPAYEKSLHLREKVLTLNHPAVAECYNDIGMAYAKIGEHSKALSHHERAFEIYQKTLPTDHPDLAISYNNLGYVYDSMGEYSKALSYYEKVQQILHKSFPGNHPNLASAYDNIGSVYDNMEDYSKALLSHEKAFEIRQKVLPENHPDLASSYNNIGYVYNKLREYSKAFLCYDAALKILHKTLSENHLSLVTTYDNIGDMYGSIGEYSKALSNYEKAFDIQQEILPAHHPGLASSCSSIGSMYHNMGEYSKALSFHERALELYQKILPENHPHLAICFNNMGLVCNKLGEYSKAHSYYEKVLEILQETRPENHLDLAAFYNNIGSLYTSMCEYSKALSSHERALQILEETLSENDPNLGASYNNIGSVYESMGEYSKALLYYEKALQILRKTLSENHPNLGASYDNIASVYESMEEYSKALSSHEKALEIYKKNLPDNQSYLACSYNNIAFMYNKMKEYSKALSYYECALHILQNTLSSEHPKIKTVKDSIEIVKKNL